VRKHIENAALLTGPGATLLIFFSGHGVIVNDQVYLIPLDGDRRIGISLEWVKGG